jgi:hypothetical protein
VAVTLFDGTARAATYANYVLRLLVEQESYDAVTNSSQVRFRLWLDGDAGWWFDQWAITGNVDYAPYNESGVKGTNVEVWNSPSGNQTQGSSGANKLWANVVKTIVHDSTGKLRLGVRADFKTNTAPSSTYNYLVAPISLGTVNSINTTTVDVVRTPAAPSTAPTLSKVGKVLTIVSGTSTALTPTGPAITHYVFQYSTNNGSTWTSGGTNIPATPLPPTLAWTVPVFPATYLIRTAAVSSEGTGAYSGASSIFVSAYGYRFALVGGVPTSTAITTAARYTGVITDTVVVGGVTYQNWKQINSVKRYTGTDWIDLVQ